MSSFLLHKSDVRGYQPPGSMLVGDVTQSSAVNSTVEIIIAVVRGGEMKGRTLGEDPSIELTLTVRGHACYLM